MLAAGVQLATAIHVAAARKARAISQFEPPEVWQRIGSAT
jgi:hypothetical protein